MKPKVYGKKSRAGPATNFEVFALKSSPVPVRSERMDEAKKQDILKEKQGNTQKAKLDVKSRKNFATENDKEHRDGELCTRLQRSAGQGKMSARSSRRDKIALECGDAKPRENSTTTNTVSRQSSPAPDDSNLAQLLEQQLNITNVTPTKGSPPRVPTTPLTPAASSIKQCLATLDSDTIPYISPLLACKNVSPLVENFQAWTTQRIHILSFLKIGEGSFGEVYRVTAKNADTVIMKIVPLNARKGRGSRSYTSIEAAATEVRLLERMQKIPGLVEFRGACVLQGRMPMELVTEWNRYKEQGRTVESKDPNKKSAYAETQLWLLVEMSDAGINLEPGYYRPPGWEEIKPGERYLSIQRTWDIFWQVVRAVAKAEVYAEFEHRDLHLGNICAKDTREASDEEDLTLVDRDEDTPFSLNHTGIQVTIIDYSLSRAWADDTDILFYEFKKDDAIMKGEGNLQYDIYRCMAEATKEEGWKSFVPKTNVLWLSYILHKLLDVTIGLSAEAMVEREGKVTTTRKLRDALEEVKGKMVLQERNDWNLGSANDIIDLGMELGWFRPDDIINR
jgi:hypothetical protein